MNNMIKVTKEELEKTASTIEGLMNDPSADYMILVMPRKGKMQMIVHNITAAEAIGSLMLTVHEFQEAAK